MVSPPPLIATSTAWIGNKVLPAPSTTLNDSGPRASGSPPPNGMVSDFLGVVVLAFLMFFVCFLSFLWFSYVFSMFPEVFICFLCFSHGFPMFFLCFLTFFVWLLCVSHAFPMFLLCFSFVFMKPPTPTHIHRGGLEGTITIPRGGWPGDPDHKLSIIIHLVALFTAWSSGWDPVVSTS